ncbi:hypothetical protein DID80_06830, partial [Candidatus Marinamargulisbacteria bacterium SCGC AAA071-K20]
MLAMAFTVSCGSSTSTSTTSTSDAVSYAGNAKITSSVSVAESSLAEIESTPSGRRIAPSDSRFSKLMLAGIDNSRTIDGADACLYELKADGTEITTNICVKVADGVAIFDGVKDGVMYVIKVIKTGDNGYAIHLESIANVPAGETTLTSEVNEKTMAIRQYIEDSLAKATTAASISLDEATFTIIVNLATQIVTDLIKTGEISLDPVVKSAADLTRLEEQAVEAGAAIESDDSMQDAQADAATIALLSADSIAIDDAKKVINRLLVVIMGESIEGFFIDAFAEQMVNGKEITLGDFASAFKGSLNSELPTVVSEYLTSDVILGLLQDEVENGLIKRIYLDHAGTDQEQVPTIAKLVFPASESAKWADVSNSTVMNVPQTLAVLISNNNLFGEGLKNDSSLPDAVKTALQSLGGDTHKDGLFDPIGMIMDMGFVKLTAGSYNFTGLRSSVVSFTDYSQGQNPQKTVALEIEVNILYPANETISKVEITYTDSNGATQTKEIPKESYGGMGGDQVDNEEINDSATDFQESRFRLDPWKRDDNGDSQAVSGFVAGTATVKVYSGATVKATETVELEIFELGDVQFISPNDAQSIGSNDDGEVTDFVVRWKEPTGNFNTEK